MPRSHSGVGECSNCGRTISGNYTAGDRCPYCGTYFEFDETNGRSSAAPASSSSDFSPRSFRFSARAVRGIIALVVMIVGAIGGVCAKVFGKS